MSITASNKTVFREKPDKPTTVLSEVGAISYALPVVTSSMLLTPLVIIQGIYAKHYGIALSTLALIILCSRIFDVITDPIIGYFSDRYRQKHGTRKPFMIIGMLSLLVCGYCLYVPPEQINATYAAVWFIAFYMAFTLFEIPHMCWPCDISSESNDRAKLYSYRVVAGYAGLVLFYCIPLLPVFPTQDITPQTLKFAFFVAAGLALPFLFQMIRAVPPGRPPVPITEAARPQRWALLRADIQAMISNKPFLIFIPVFLFAGFSVGMWYGLIYLYVDAYLKMGDQFAKMFLFAFVVGILVTPLWYKIAFIVGKKKTLFTAFLLLIICYLFTGSLTPETVSFTKLIILKTIQTSALVASFVVVPSMLAEIVDYSQWKTGVENSGTYFSVRVFFDKIANTLGVASGLAIASGYGFVATETVFSQETIIGLKMAIAWMPVILTVVSLVFIVLSPINERRHKIIKQRLEARLARSLALSQMNTHSESKEKLDSQQQEVHLNAS